MKPFGAVLSFERLVFLSPVLGGWVGGWEGRGKRGGSNELLWGRG